MDKVGRQALALQIAQDGYALLEAMDAEQAPEWLRHLPARRRTTAP